MSKNRLQGKVIVAFDVEFNENATQEHIDVFLKDLTEALKFKSADVINLRKPHIVKSSCLSVEPLKVIDAFHDSDNTGNKRHDYRF